MGSSTRAALAEGVFLGGYRIVRRLAEGRFWDVYLARSSSTQRVVVLDIVHEDVPEERVRRFLLRAGELAALEHPHVARVFESGLEGGIAYFAQEYIEGPRGRALSLAEELRNHGGCLPEDTVRLRGRQVWEGLRAAHGFRELALNWGGNWLDEALLTPQHRVKLLAPGLRGILAGEDSTGPAGVAADVRGFGEYLFLGLTGCPLGPQAPSALGVPRSWDRVVEACRTASAETLPTDRIVYDGLLTAGKPSRRGWILAGIAALVLLAGGIPAAWILRGANRPSREELARNRALEEQARLDQQVDKYLKAAESALARMEFAAARRVVEQVLKETPGQPKAVALLADITAAEGLAKIGTTKNAADEAWAQVRDLPTDQGVGDRLGEIKLALDTARLALADNRFEVAETHFAKVLTLAQQVQQADVARDDAVRARTLVGDAREAASGNQAAAFASETWQRAVEADNGAVAAFEKGEFAPAGQLWQEAERQYALAETEATGRREVNRAKDLFARQMQDARESPVPLPAEVFTQAGEQDRLAQAALAENRWPEAAKHWQEGTNLLATAYVKVTEGQRRQSYQEALETGRKLLAAKDYAGAELAFSQALAQPGFGADPLVLRLHEQTRLVRVALASNQAWRGADGNLAFNGDFETGQDRGPEGWTAPDNLTVFWDSRGVSGKCIRMDTDVYRSEWEEHRKNPEQPITKTPTSGTKYNTVGGTTGVAVYSRPIPVDPDAYYEVAFDVRGKGEPFLYVKGYWKCGPQDLHAMGKKMFFKPFKPGPSFSLVAMGTSGEEKRDAHPGDFIQCFRRRVVARVDKPGEWRRFKTVMKLEADRRIEVVLLELYAFWPPGDFFFDNVTFRKVTEEDAKAHEAWRQKMGEAANFGIPVEPSRR